MTDPEKNALNVVARAVLHFASSAAGDFRDLYPHVSDHGWCEILRRVEALAQAPAPAVYYEACKTLRQRADA